MKTMDIANKEEALRLQSGMPEVSSPRTYGAEAPSDIIATSKQQTLRAASGSVQNKSSGDKTVSEAQKSLMWYTSSQFWKAYPELGEIINC